MLSRTNLDTPDAIYRSTGDAFLTTQPPIITTLPPMKNNTNKNPNQNQKAKPKPKTQNPNKKTKPKIKTLTKNPSQTQNQGQGHEQGEGQGGGGRGQGQTIASHRRQPNGFLETRFGVHDGELYVEQCRMYLK